MPQGLIIFDCDGVLVDSEPLAARAYVDVFHRYGMAITESLIARSVGLKQADIMNRIEDETGHRLPEGAEPDLWLRLKELFEKELSATSGLTRFLERSRLRRCIASSSHPERIAFSLTVTGLKTQFGEALFSSTMVRHGKPAPDLFLHAAASMATDPALCTVFEDSPFGIMGAKAAGMRAIGYLGGGHVSDGHGEALVAAGADGLITNWDEADALFA